MSTGLRPLIVVVLALAALGTALIGSALLVPLVLGAMAVGVATVLLSSQRPERMTLLLAVAVVSIGAIGACVHVVGGIADSQVDFGGKLDVGEINRTFQPSRPGGSATRPRDPELGYLSSAEGKMTVPGADDDVVALWSTQQLAPWLLAAIVLALAAPILRAAERGAPFWEGAPRRLIAIGVLLLVGIPGIEILRFGVAELASEGSFVSPGASPELNLSIGQFLPGVVVMVLAGTFGRGVELRDLERHTI